MTTPKTLVGDNFDTVAFHGEGGGSKKIWVLSASLVQNSKCYYMIAATESCPGKKHS